MPNIHWTKHDLTLPNCRRTLVWTTAMAGDGYSVHRIRSGVDDGLFHASVRCAGIGHAHESLAQAIESCSRAAGMQDCTHTWDT